jgi:hypothetical protein
MTTAEYKCPVIRTAYSFQAQRFLFQNDEGQKKIKKQKKLQKKRLDIEKCPV